MTDEFNSLNLVPTIPVDPDIVTYTKFGSTYEAYEFTDWRDESMSWKDRLYLGDWTSMFKFTLKGPDARKFLEKYTCTSFQKFEVGQAKHCISCNTKGQVIGEGVLQKRAEDEYYYTGGPGTFYIAWRFQTEGDKYDLEGWADNNNENSIIQVQGPKTLEVMEEFIGESLRDIKFMHFKTFTVDGMTFDLLRQGMSGTIGFEIHGKTADGKKTWARIMEIGKKYGIAQLGGRTKMVNHVEACFPTPSCDYITAVFNTDDPDLQRFVREFYDVLGIGKYQVNRAGSAADENDPSTLYFTPYDWGWGKVVKFDHDFIGREALEKLADNPPRGVCTLVWDKEDVLDVFASYFEKGEPYKFMEFPRELLGCVVGDKVLSDGKQIGVTTSRTYSYYFREMISLCVLDSEYLTPGTRVEILWGDNEKRQKTIHATVQPAPYKKDTRRQNLADL